MNGPKHAHPDTPITNKIIDDADACPETRVVFLIKHLANQCRAFERAQRAEELPPEPTHAMLKALAGDPVILAASDEAELRARYAAMVQELRRSPMNLDRRKEE